MINTLPSVDKGSHITHDETNDLFSICIALKLWEMRLESFDKKQIMGLVLLFLQEGKYAVNLGEDIQVLAF